jgi:hypothetical protein
MQKQMKHLRTVLLYLSVAFGLSACREASPPTGWKAGVAQVKITPAESMWLAGYAARDHASEGVLQDLWAKALVLEDSAGHRSLLVALDVTSITKDIADRIRKELNTRLGLTPAQIILNCSHTHSGPVLPGTLPDIYPLDEEEKEKVNRYGAFFEKQVIDAAVRASQSMEPVSLHAANGVARMQVNRRNNSERDLNRQTELKGPNDFAVPVLKVTGHPGQLKAVVFAYACHPTVLDGYLWSGDWPGYARETLEEWYPGVTALFFQGAGADQNPLPRRSVPLARQHGVTVAAAVDRVLREDMTALPPTLKTAYREILLPLDAPPSEEALDEMIRTAGGDYRTRWARRTVTLIRRGEPLPDACPYGLQAWNIGGWPLFALGGELTAGYAIRLKRTYGEHAFVLGYTNDVMAYIPTEAILEEGGYEGRTSMMAFGLPAPWLPGIEELICKSMEDVAGQAGIPCVNGLPAEK